MDSMMLVRFISLYYDYAAKINKKHETQGDMGVFSVVQLSGIEIARWIIIALSGLGWHRFASVRGTKQSRVLV